MKELLKEYQSVLITTIAVVFTFVCVYSMLPYITEKSESFKAEGSALNFINESNQNYGISLEYPKGNRIRLVKGNEFELADYIVIKDSRFGESSNYEYMLYVNGKAVESFNTETCGGYSVVVEILYQNKVLEGELLVIIEER